MGLVVAASVPLLAHHTISWYYDTTTLVTMRGVVTEVEWKQPHVRLHLDVKNEQGESVGWTVETRGPLLLTRAGLDRDFVKVGETVSVDVFVSKDGTHAAALETITLPTKTIRLSMLPSRS
jgi:hypothetical protein